MVDAGSATGANPGSYFPLRHAQVGKSLRRSKPGRLRLPFAGWMLPIALMAILGGGSWTDPIPRFLCQLIAVGLLVRVAASGRSKVPARVVLEDWLILAAFALIAIQLFPLPPEIWARLPGRALALAIDKRVWGFAHWRPLSLDPPATWRAALTLLPGLAVYCAIRTGSELRLRAFISGFVLAGAVSLGRGMMQLLFPEWLELRPYGPDETNWPIGNFANHNHQGLFLLCVLLLLAMGTKTELAADTFVSRNSSYVLGTAVILIGLMVLATGSRTCAALLIPVLIAAPFCRPEPFPVAAHERTSAMIRSAMRHALPILGIVTIIALGGALALSTLNRGEIFDDLRWDFWPDVWQAVFAFWPVGAGLGTFVEAFAMHEPLTSLSSRYLNHAHNDYLEIILEAGIPGLALMLAILARIFKSGAEAWLRPATCTMVRSARAAPRAASLALMLVVLGSAVDYPARTFAISALVGLCWAIMALTAEAAKEGHCCPPALGMCACEDEFTSPETPSAPLLSTAKP